MRCALDVLLRRTHKGAKGSCGSGGGYRSAKERSRKGAGFRLILDSVWDIEGLDSEVIGGVAGPQATGGEAKGGRRTRGFLWKASRARNVPRNRLSEMRMEGLTGVQK